MSFLFECNVSLQDCEVLWPPTPPIPGYPNQRVLPWVNGSCVQDIRLPGMIGRCGWPGAPCSVAGEHSNCGYASPQVCQGGVCAGAVGDSCTIDDDCNWGIYCNASTGNPTTTTGDGVCGGAGAQVDTTDFSAGLDFGRDYCLSGLATKITNGPWVCAPGPPLVLSTSIGPPLPTSTFSPSASSFGATATVTTQSHPTTPLVGPVVGGVVGGTAFLAGLAFLTWYMCRWHAGVDRVVSVQREEMERDVVDRRLIPDPFVYFPPAPPAAQVAQPYHGPQDEAPPPFTAEAEEGRVVYPHAPPPYPGRLKRFRR